MTTIEVCCAVIIQSDRILVTQRSAESRLAWKWEFPGGKILPGETRADCIVREIREELNLDIEPIEELPEVIHCDRDRTIRLIPFLCRIRGGELKLNEHHDSRWVLPSGLSELDWSEPDRPVWIHVHDHFSECVHILRS
jgi:8-oxo-dGTP diphosphatase